MNDFRQYKGIDYSYHLSHFGVGHLHGGHSGRFPWGSGDRPKQSLEGGGNSNNTIGSSKKSTNRDGESKAKRKASGINSKTTLRDIWDDPLKRKLIIAGAAAAVYGGYYLYGTGAIGRGMDAVSEVMNGDISKKVVGDIANLSEKAKATRESLIQNGFTPLQKMESAGEALRKINPYYLTKQGQMNCFSCSFAYVLRRHLGLDVTAIKSTTGIQLDELVSVIKNGKTNVVDASSDIEGTSWQSSFDARKAIEKTLLKSFNENGAAGVITVAWKPPYGGGHAFNWEIVDGKVKWVDAQPGFKSAVDAFKHFDRVETDWPVYLMRLDNAEFDMDKLKGIVTVH